MICIDSIGRDSDQYTKYCNEHVGKCPPRVVGVWTVEDSDYRRSKGDDPGHLRVMSIWKKFLFSTSSTYHRYRYSRQCKWVASDVAEAESLAIVTSTASTTSSIS